MTHREFYIMVLNGVINDEVKQKAAENLAYLDNHYTHTTPAQSEHDKLKQSILNIITGQNKPITGRELALATNCSIAKACGICRGLMNEGKIQRHTIRVPGIGEMSAYSLV